jgi:hypothetical protein
VIIQSPLQRYTFAGFLIPLQFALLYKEVFLVVPARYFYGIQARSESARIPKHPGPPRVGKAGQELLVALCNLLKRKSLSHLKRFGFYS